MNIAPGNSYVYLRHAWPVRVMHWVNVLAIVLLLMSGLQIFNAHPILNWGKSSYTGDAPILELSSEIDAQGNTLGVTQIFGHKIRTTGFLGASADSTGALTARGFPGWLTIPGPQWLAMARRWHFFWAWVFVVNGLLYVGYSAISRHFATDLAPTRRDWKYFGRSVVDHIRFRHPAGEAARHYNILQKVTYIGVIFGLLPFVALMGLAMSPRLDSLWPGWVDLVGGRQSARTLHFFAAVAIVGFVLVHVFEVIISGLWNNLRSMITGRYAIEAPKIANPEESLAPSQEI